MSDGPVERASDRSSVKAAAADGPVAGLIQIRTPEGLRLFIPPERALEWISDRGFQDAVRYAVLECRGGITLKVKEEKAE